MLGSLELELDPPLSRMTRGRSPSNPKGAPTEGTASGKAKGGGKAERGGKRAPTLTLTPSRATGSEVGPAPPQDWISLILGVVIERDGNMTAEEAMRVLRISDKRPKWLLSQVCVCVHGCTCMGARA